jgi:TonB family protein
VGAKVKDKLTNSLHSNGEMNQKGTGISSWYKRRFLLATILSSLLHSVVLVLLLDFLPNPKINKKQRALQVWLKEPKSPAIKTVDKKTVVQFFVDDKKRIKPKKANYLSDQDSFTEKETKALAPASSLNNNSKEKSRDARLNHENHRQGLTKDDVLLAPKKLVKSADPWKLKPRISDETMKFGHGSLDHLAQVEEGEDTKLNAWQWRHAPFFHRIKSRIGNIWSPQKQIARYDPEGVLLGHKDRVTTVIVTIDQEGQLKNLLVSNPSGIAYLDEEAVRAIREAAPFSFPPLELFNEYGEFSFRFGFYLQVNQGFSFDFNW